jgi:2-polyprenyl-6-methoxyphenol hydroxylase-like FAD-dependent oxidoreductase
MTPSPQLRIAIVGGGPAGLTLGTLLHNHSIPFTLFEFRPRPTDEEYAQPSGSLDMHEESGLAALRACGLFDAAMKLTGDCTEESKIADRNGNIIYSDEGSNDRPEIYRNDLNRLLTQHIPPASIKWSHKLRSATRIVDEGGEKVKLDFGEHGSEVFDFVVGADGAWSRVRPLLTDRKPEFADMHNITLTIRGMTERYPDLLALIGHGTFMSMADKNGVFAQRASQDSARMYIMLTTPSKDFVTESGLAGKTPLESRELLVGDGSSILSQWGEKIKHLVAAACEDEEKHNAGAKLDVKPFYRLPPGHTWEHRADATMIGDAAHLMNPPAGEGVNIAMHDALLLGQAIIKACEGAEHDHAVFRSALDDGIREFEVNMAKRALEMAEGTKELSEVMFGSDDGALAMANWFKSMIESAA